MTSPYVKPEDSFFLQTPSFFGHLLLAFRGPNSFFFQCWVQKEAALEMCDSNQGPKNQWETLKKSAANFWPSGFQLD